MRQTILLVDDDDDDAFIFREVLDKVFSDVDFLHAQNGLEGLRVIKKLPPWSSKLIFLDWNMPLMGGKEFLLIRQEEEKLRPIPTFVLTTTKDAETKDTALAAGATDFFTKPSDLNDLENILKGVMVRYFDKMPSF